MVDDIEDLDPHRTVTYLENGVPHCYMGHTECYDAHTTERLSDETDCEEDLAVADEDEYTEPTNAQLARFLVIDAKNDPRLEGLQLSPPILESLLSQNPKYKEAALRRHRRFQDQLKELSRKIDAGELQCEHILRSGKQCPNRNEPGIAWCGLHKEEHGEGDPRGEDA